MSEQQPAERNIGMALLALLCAVVLSLLAHNALSSENVWITGIGWGLACLAFVCACGVIFELFPNALKGDDEGDD